MTEKGIKGSKVVGVIMLIVLGAMAATVYFAKVRDELFSQTPPGATPAEAAQPDSKPQPKNK